MVNYETLMLLCTEMTDDELGMLEKHLDKLISDKKGKITLFDKWGKYKLAYPVRKSVYGIYALMRYQIPADAAKVLSKEIDNLFKIKHNEVVMRYVNVKLNKEVSSVYKHPAPITSGRTSNLESFLHENKMKGIIDTDIKKKPEAKEVEAPAKEVSESSFAKASKDKDDFDSTDKVDVTEDVSDKQENSNEDKE